MVHSRNDGTSFNVLGIDGCVTPTFACTPKFSQIESNVLPIILIQSSDFLYLSFKEKAKARSFSIMFRSPSHLERTISYLSDRVPMYSSWVGICFSTYIKMLENSMIGYISIGSYRIKGDDWQSHPLREVVPTLPL